MVLKRLKVVGLALLACVCTLGGGVRGAGEDGSGGGGDGKVRVLSAFKGGQKIPLTIRQDGQVTIALYNKNDQPVRILAQLLEMKAGQYELPWDGMDLWGNLVPADTELTLRVISNPGIKAVYEFSVADAGNPPWGTRTTGEGDARRAGGWLGDHTGPSSAAALGNKLFFGSKVVEHGNNLIATTLAGEKMWGTQVAGWTGPRFLAADAGAGVVYVVVNDGHRVLRMDPETFKLEPFVDTAPDDVQAISAGNGLVTMVLKNHASLENPFRVSIGKGVDFSRSQPTAQPGAAVEFQLSGQSSFSTVFTRGGHVQTGLSAAATGGDAFVMVAFQEPITIGTLLMEKVDAEAANIYVLKEGVKLEPVKHGPRSGGKGEDDLGLGADLAVHEDWVPFGQVKFDRLVSVVTAPKADMKTESLYIRFPGGGKNTARPGLRMCRILPRRVASVPMDAALIWPESVAQVPAEQKLLRMGGKALSWEVKAGSPLSEIAPVPLVVDLRKPLTFRGLLLHNNVNQQFKIEAYTGPADGDLASATDDAWTPVTTFKSGYTKSDGVLSSSINAHDVEVPFAEEVTTRALRLTYTAGIGQGRGLGKVAEDFYRIACADMQLLSLIDKGPAVPTHIVRTFDGAGKKIGESLEHKADIRGLAVAPGGPTYVLTPKELRVAPPGTAAADAAKAGGPAKPVTGVTLTGANALAVSKDRVAVSDVGANAVHLLDHSGRTIATIKGPYKRGWYDPMQISRPSGLTFAGDGNLWVTEEAYHPKRIACFSPDGKHLRDFFGPPEYGGGGALDPNLKSFYYRGMEFGIDFAKGAWSMKAFNDRFASPESPALDAGSFSYTGITRPIYHKGFKYIVGGSVVNLYDEAAATWKPAAVMGSAKGSVFLLNKTKWKTHWLAQDLKDKFFIWCDRNGDGDYQLDEVELFKLAEKGRQGPFSQAYWGSRMGRDLTFWGGAARLAPTTITDKGVPIYESRNIQYVSYGDLAPVYSASFTAGAAAKPGYGGATIVAADGSLLLEGQPYRIGPDLKIVGGEISAKPSDYIPPIGGVIMDNPLGFVGSAVTKSPVGEVAIMNGDNGHWFIQSARHNVLVGRIFTGKAGGFGGVPNARGTDVTHNKQDWETFSGYFTKANDGNYYVVAGKGYHGISRVENLDAYSVDDSPLRVTADGYAANARLRPLLVQQARADKHAKRADKTMAVTSLAHRTQKFRLDGELEDWGGVKTMSAMDDPELAEAPTEVGELSGDLKKRDSMLHVAAAHDEKGLYLAYSGVANMINSGTDPKFIFKTGFFFDFAYRGDPRARGKALVPGDRRIVFSRLGDKWVAVMFDYVDAKTPEEKYVEYASPVAVTKVARVAVMSDSDVKIVVRSGYDLERRVPKGMKDFTAEVFIKWEALGIAQSNLMGLKADFGIMSADAGGTFVDKRWYWANPNTEAVTDIAMEAAVNPATFGTFVGEKK